MDFHDGSSPQERFRAYATDLASVLGHADRVRPVRGLLCRLLSTEGRKSVEPLAATTAPNQQRPLLSCKTPVSFRNSACPDAMVVW